MKRLFAFALSTVMILALTGCQKDANNYLTVKYDDYTEHAFLDKNIKVICDLDGYRVNDVAGELGYQFEITGFDSETKALEYALNYK